MATETFKTQLKLDIITALNLPDITPEDINNDEALFGEGLGLDSIDSLVDLRAAHENSAVMGLDVFTGKVADMKEAGVIEPKRVKKQAIQSASEAAEMILRIDDVIASSGKGDADMGGMDPAAMGGMPPMM